MPQVSKFTKQEYKKILVEGIAMYASVHKPKKPFTPGDIPAYTLDLIVTDEEAQKLEAEGLKRSKVKVDEDTKRPKEYSTHPGLKVFQFRRKTHKRGETPGIFGEAKTPLKVVDSKGNTIPNTVLIGNGSRVRVSINPYTMTISGRQITGHDLLGVQVLELVEYKGNGSASSSDFPVENKGFTVSGSEASSESFSHDEDPFADS